MRRLRLTTALALALPVAIAAQRPPNVSTRPGPGGGAPSGVVTNTVTQQFRDFGGHYGGLLMAAFDSIPAERYGFRPAPAQMTVGTIAAHLENANYALCERIGGQTHTKPAQDSLADSVRGRWPKDTLVARLRASLEFCGHAYEHVSDASLGSEVPTSRIGETAPRVRMMLYFTTDLAEHYAQLAAYMRQMGLVPPSALPRRASR